MRGYSAAAVVLAPALAGCFSLETKEDSVPSAYVTLHLDSESPGSFAPDLTFRFDVLDSKQACGYANVTINRQELLTDHDGTGRGSIAADQGMLVASWDFKCISWDGAPQEQLLNFDVQYVNGKAVSGVGFTLRFQQVAPVWISDIEGTATMTRVHNGLMPDVVEDRVDMEPDLNMQIEELAFLKSRILELENEIFTRERQLSGKHGWSDKARLSQCDSLKCVFNIIYGRLSHASKALHGGFARTGSRPHHPNHGKGPEHERPHGHRPHGNHTHPPPPPPPPRNPPHHRPHHGFPHPPPFCRCPPPPPPPPPHHEPPQHSFPPPPPPPEWKPPHHEPPHEGLPHSGPPYHPGEKPPHYGGPSSHPSEDDWSEDLDTPDYWQGQGLEDHLPPPPPPPFEPGVEHPMHDDFTIPPGAPNPPDGPAPPDFPSPPPPPPSPGHEGHKSHHKDGKGAPPPPPHRPHSHPHHNHMLGSFPALPIILGILFTFFAPFVFTRCRRHDASREVQDATFVERHECSAGRRAERRRRAREFLRRVFFAGDSGDEEEDGDGEEKRAMLSMEEDISSFRAAADVVGEMVAAEEGRVRRSELLPVPARPYAGFGRASMETLPEYQESEPSPSSGGISAVADGLRYTPGSEEYTPGSGDAGNVGSSIDDVLGRSKN